jgi:class 3 adenylate cyclase
VGLFDQLDDYGLDLHFRYLSAIEADPRIVLIDINDHAIRTVEDWPWRRRRYAQLVQTLNELGAGAIVLDLVLDDPAEPDPPGPGKHYDVDTELIQFGDPSTDPVIYDDDELRDAIAEAASVYLAMFFRLSSPGVGPLTSPGQDGPSPKARIDALLGKDFSLDAPALLRVLDGSGELTLRTVEELMPQAKRRVARHAATRFLADHAEWGFEEFFKSVLPGADFQVLSPDRNDLIEAYRAAHAFRALASRNPMASTALSARIPHAHDLTLPVDKFARAARGIGFVTFEREKSGGVVREIPLLADAAGVLVSQLGFLVATDVLGIDRSSISYSGGHLLMGTGAQQRRLPVARDGSVLLNWHVPEEVGRWQDSFHHIPVTRVLEIGLNTEAIRENERRFGLAMALLVELRHAETPAEYADYVRLVNRRRVLRQGTTGDDSDEPDTTGGELAEIESRIGRVEEDAALWLGRVHGLWQTTEPANDQERAQRDRINELHATLGEGRLAARLAEFNARLTARIRALREELRPQIDGKICLVGYTASGVADLVTSPVYDSMPGVMAHANIINMILQDRPPARASTAIDMLIMLVAGIAVTIITCVRGPVFSAGSLLVVVAVLFGVGALTFWSSSYHLASLAAGTQTCVVWACVTAYRQFTEERTRRQFHRALAQYTSPAVAARIAGRARVNDLAPQRARVTCFFSDLRGFTPLSERLGAERTRLLLNPYLRTMSRVLVAHHAIINKFIGDGIFAFFNAPIWPCANHSESACACALASADALRELNRQRAAAGDGEPLVMRIGISTGEVFVGDYGSDTKLDYTCIGDTVNLAARLEEANKTLGTTILVDDACRQDAGDRFEFRSLGRIEIPGKTLPVDVHELIGPAE